MKILVIEKSEVCRFLLDQCLSSLGHVVHYCTGADEALQLFQTNEIDFVFIDADSGRLNSLDTIKAFRTPIKPRWFPIVALCSETDDDTFASAILAGADAVISKPLSRSRILMQVIALERIYIVRQNLEAKKDLIAANLALLKLSMYDEVTNLPNRRYFEETLNKEMKLAKRSRRPLALLLCEIDSAGYVQKEEEIASQNRRLHAIAAVISSIPSRPTDFVARYGGNSYAVILPNTDQDGAIRILEKIRVSVESALAKNPVGYPMMPPVFRIGLALYTEQLQTMDDFIRVANTALSKRCLETAQAAHPPVIPPDSASPCLKLG